MVLLQVLRYLKLRYYGVVTSYTVFKIRYYGVVTSYTVFKMTLLWCSYVV
jgi:hypothetical protein